jgi:hypothetical protein
MAKEVKGDGIVKAVAISCGSLAEHGWVIVGELQVP